MAESGEVNSQRQAASPADASTLKRALLAIEKLQAKLDAVEREKREPIAIVGIGCRFPGAGNVEEYWQLLADGVDAISVVPPDRWDANAYLDPEPGAPAKMVTRWGGFLPEVDKFDAGFFGISPREAARMDPQQRLLLECSWEALERAGIAADRLAGSRTGVFVGISQVDYGFMQFEDRRRLDAYAGTGNALCVAANRISYLLDLRGPSVAMDTACSSSLVATHTAVESLRRRECDLALAAGVNLILGPELSIIFSHAHMLAPDGRCKTFDAAADGYVRGEGVGVLALKRLSDAQRDGDPIVAVILGSAINQDGRSNGLTAPNGLAQQAVIRDALANAKIKPEQVTYIEAHGTGTVLGDPIEMNALAAVMRGRADKCIVGSAKTNIGHLEAAAGVAGLIKAALQIQRGEIAPHLHLNKVNPYIAIDEMPLEIALGRRLWPADRPRIAGVSSFGFGGANAHIVLGPAPETTRAAPAGPDHMQHLLTLSAANQHALAALAQGYAAYLRTASEPLADVCHTANVGRSALRTRAAVVAATGDEMREKLSALAGEPPASKVRGGKTAFLFTGQGSQYEGMGRRLYETAPVFRAALDRCDALLADLLPHRLSAVLYGADAQTGLIHDTTYTQPALFAIEYALAQLWQSWSVRPDYLLGHSIGELVAAVIAGVFSLEDGLRLVAARGRLMGSLPTGGAMAAVFAGPEQVTPYLDGPDVTLAAVNGPKSVVISGRGEKVAAIAVRLEAAGLTVRPMTVSHAFHSPLMDPILDEFEAVAASIPANPPAIPIVSNLTGQPYDGAPDAAYWRRHLREAVQFNAGMRRLAELGCRALIETGPHPALITMGKRCVPDHEALWLPSLRRPEGPEADDWLPLLESLGQYWSGGYEVDWPAFDAPYSRRKVVIPTYPFQRERYWNESPVAALRRKGWTGGVAPELEADAAAGDEPADETTADINAEVETAAQRDEPTREQILDAPFEMRRGLLIDAIRGSIARVLALPAARITADQQLNHLGLDSIMAIELKSAVETSLQVELPISALLAGPTVAELADMLLASMNDATLTAPPLVIEEGVGSEPRDYPLTVGQAAMWLQHQVAPGSVYNPVYAARVVGPLDVDRLRGAFQRLVDRHPALRTVFVATGGKPVQRVLPAAEVDFAIATVDGMDDAALETRMAEDAYRVFDLERGPLLRVRVYARGDERTLLLAAHHIVVDLWSLAVVISELGSLYADPDAALPDAPVRFTDFARWQESLLPSPAGERMLAYWKDTLGGLLPVLELPTDRPRPAVQTFEGSVESLDLGAALTAQVREFSDRMGVTPYVTLLTAFASLLHRYTGQDEIVVGSPTTGRSRAELANVVGYFVSPVAVRARFDEGATVSETVRRMREMVLGSLANADYPFPLLVEKLHPRRDPSRTPIFQVMFALQRSHLLYEEGLSQFATGSSGQRMDLSGLPLESVEIKRRMSPFDVTMLLADSEQAMSAAIEYNADLFDATTVRRMLGHYKTLLAGLVAAPEQAVAELPLLTPEEEARILGEWSVGPEIGAPKHATIHAAFEAQVARTPDNTALYFDPGAGAAPVVWNYAELNHRANALAHRLQGLGVGPERRVALCMERSPEMIVAILGVLKAGGAYIPLDPAAPRERLTRILTDAQPDACLTQRKEGKEFANLPVIEVNSETLSASSAAENVVSGARGDNLAYIIYTSGSTGAPKGVMLQHSGLVNLAEAQIVAFDVTPEDRVYQFASYTFDASLSEIFIALTSGAALHISRADVTLSPDNLTRALREQRITNITLPPTLLRLMDPLELPDLRVIISAGDACTPDIVQRWAPGRRFINAYGPTETTIGPTYYVVNDGKRDFTPGDGPAPIGRPIHRMNAFILDRRMRPLPAGIPGELHIGGIGLARGYVGRPDLTAEKFAPNLRNASLRLALQPGARLYRTGDLARWNADGQLEFIGRADYQVKIRGFRVELGEIEAALKQSAGVREAVVLAVNGGGPIGEPKRDLRLVAYVVPNAQPCPTEAELRAQLRAILPDYMVPAAFVTLDALPLNSSGKADRRELLKLAPDTGKPGGEVVLPQNQLERDLLAIWQGVLGVERVSVRDNFFDLGGHSLMMAQAHSKLQTLLGREVPIVDLFRFPTIHQLAAHLADGGVIGPAVSAQQGQERGQQKRDAMNAQRARAEARMQQLRTPTGGKK